MKSALKLTAAALGAALCAGAWGAQLYSDDEFTFDMYGRAGALLLSRSGSQPDRIYANGYGDDSLVSTFRLGLASRSKITDGLDAVMLAEWDMPDGTVQTDTRYLYAGIDAYQYGTLLFGRGDSAYYAVAGATDIYNYLDSRANGYYIMGDTLPGQIMYRLAALSYDLRLSYQTSSAHINGSPFSIRNAGAISLATQIFENVNIAYGISYSDLTYDSADRSQDMQDYFKPILAQDYNLSRDEAAAFIQNHKPGHKYDYGFAVSYGYLGAGPYAAFVFTGTDYEYLRHQLYTYETALSYSFNNGITVSGGVELQHYDDFFTAADLKLGLAYSFGPSFKVFAESQMDLGAQPEKFFGESLPYGYGEDKYVIGAEFTF